MRTDTVRRRGFPGAWVTGAAAFLVVAAAVWGVLVAAILSLSSQLDAAEVLNTDLRAQLARCEDRPPGDCCQSLFECGTTVERLEVGCNDAGVEYIERANLLFECEQTICPTNGWVCESPECAYVSADDYLQQRGEP